MALTNAQIEELKTKSLQFEEWVALHGAPKSVG
jgi:hypothetical protein